MEPIVYSANEGYNMISTSWDDFITLVPPFLNYKHPLQLGQNAPNRGLRSSVVNRNIAGIISCQRQQKFQSLHTDLSSKLPQKIQCGLKQRSKVLE